MKQKIIIPFIACIALAAIVFAGSAFAKKDKAKKQITYDYFQYSPTTGSESNYETASNWSSLGTSNPSSNPCTSGADLICVVKVDHSLISGRSGSTLTDKFMNYLQSLSDSAPGANDGATNFVTSSNNYTYRKDVP